MGRPKPLFIPLLLWGFIFLNGMLCAQNLTLHIEVQQIIPRKGTLRVALFDSSGFKTKTAPLAWKTVAANNNDTLRIDLNNLKAGIYAVAVYQDTNNNRQMDRQRLGIPAEPYGFSKSPPRIRPPRFKESALPFRNDTVIQIILLHPPEQKRNSHRR